MTRTTNSKPGSHTDKAERYVLRLYVAGTTARSMVAIDNLRKICDKHLHDPYDLEVIDIYQHPEIAGKAQIIAAPTLVKLAPGPVSRVIGDLSNEEKVLFVLNIASQVAYGS
ncbi:MAG: thiol-disulfide isomerase [Herminiimonas sp.]|nr:thiol-disulfide isomerase [Herminiimonas sp.]MDB5853819.1 thiol-disulfide isomerase [Herminiimonas sp.]